MKLLDNLTDDDLKELLIGQRLRREQLRKQMQELPIGTARRIAQKYVEDAEYRVRRLEDLLHPISTLG